MLQTVAQAPSQPAKPDASALAAPPGAALPAVSFATLISALLPMALAPAPGVPTGTARPGIESKPPRPASVTTTAAKCPTAKDVPATQPATPGAIPPAQTDPTTPLALPSVLPPQVTPPAETPGQPQSEPSGGPAAISGNVTLTRPTAEPPPIKGGNAAAPANLRQAAAPQTQGPPPATDTQANPPPLPFAPNPSPPEPPSPRAASATHDPSPSGAATPAPPPAAAPAAKATLKSAQIDDRQQPALPQAAPQAPPPATLPPPLTPQRIEAPGAATPTATPASIQVAHAVNVLVQQSADSHALTIQLNPTELGSVQIRVQHKLDAGVQVAVVAERPETMLLLLRDHDGLRQALAQAGVSVNTRDISYQVGSAGAPVPQGGPGLGQSSMGQSNMGQQGAQNQQGTAPDHGRASWFTLPTHDAAPSTPPPPAATGLDITA